MIKQTGKLIYNDNQLTVIVYYFVRLFDNLFIWMFTPCFPVCSNEPASLCCCCPQIQAHSNQVLCVVAGYDVIDVSVAVTEIERICKQHSVSLSLAMQDYTAWTVSSMCFFFVWLCVRARGRVYACVCVYVCVQARVRDSTHFSWLHASFHAKMHIRWK